MHNLGTGNLLASIDSVGQQSVEIQSDLLKTLRVSMVDSTFPAPDPLFHSCTLQLFTLKSTPLNDIWVYTS